MRKPSSTNFEENFEALLNWLDPDRERAGEKYVFIRQQLVKMFAWRGATDPEDLADETINRVISKVSEVESNYLGDPGRYFFGVAKNVLRETQRRSSKIASLDQAENVGVPSGEDDDREPLLECLDECILKLSPERRELLFDYYEGAKQGRISDNRREIASRLDLRPTALRMAVHRTRSMLELCIENCMKSRANKKD